MAEPELTTAPPLRVVAPKPKMTIYYALLIIALIAMLTACLFLYLEIRRFGGFGTVQGRVSAIDQRGGSSSPPIGPSHPARILVDSETPSGAMRA